MLPIVQHHGKGNTVSDIYDQHQAAFAQVSAFVVLDKGERVANVAFKYPRDGAGRLYAYVHWFGVSMVRGYASDGGYDKKSAAASAAAARITRQQQAHDGHDVERQQAFITALAKDDGYEWHHNLEAAGFTVFQAV